MDINVTGGVSYRLQSGGSSANLRVLDAAFGTVEVVGTVDFPGRNGGAAHLSLDVKPLLGFLPVYIGKVGLHDSGAGVSLDAVHLFGPVQRRAARDVSGSTSWFYTSGFLGLDIKSYTINWRVTAGSSPTPTTTAPPPVSNPTAVIRCITLLGEDTGCSYGGAPRGVILTGMDSRPSSAASSIEQYLWNFGDGVTATGRDVFHEYGLGGAYNVKLTVTDSAGRIGEATRVVTVQAAPPPITPRNFDIYGSGFQHMRLRWDRVPDADLGYEVEVEVVRGCIAYGSHTYAFGQDQVDVRVDDTWFCYGSVYKARARSLKTGTPPSDWTEWQEETI